MKIPKKRKSILTVGLFLVFLFGLIFIPPNFTQQKAENFTTGINKEKTIKEEQNFWQNLWEQKYIVFSISKENQPQAHFLTLKRNWNLLTWNITEEKTETAEIAEGLSEDEEQTAAQENLEKLYQAVKNGQSLTTINTNQETTISEDLTSPGSIHSQITDSQNQYEAKIIIGDIQDSNKLILNDKEIAKNVTEVNFDLDSKYLYYTKYSVEIVSEETGFTKQTSSGIIYRYNLTTQKERVK